MPEPTRIPRYLDLGLYATQDGIPFTHSSNLHSALRAAIKRFAQGLPYEEMAALGAWLRARLRALGFMLLAPEGHASPVIVTIVLPPDIAAMKVGEELEAEGFLLSYRSTYLRARNWIQISLMGECSQNRLLPLLDALQRYAPAREAAPAAAPAAVLAPAPAS
jgi:aspartate aminotransferase-like enzyme